MSRAISIIKWTPGPPLTAALLVLGLGVAGTAWHISQVAVQTAAHLRQETRITRQTTVTRRQQWRTLAGQVTAYGRQPGQSINTTVPLALGALERAAVACDTPLSSLTSTAQGALYALNPGQVAQPVPWAPGVKTVTFIAQGQWHTLSGLSCLAQSLRHRPAALGALNVNATSYTVVLEVLGD